jgi:hypothetical protein
MYVYPCTYILECMCVDSERWYALSRVSRESEVRGDVCVQLMLSQVDATQVLHVKVVAARDIVDKVLSCSHYLCCCDCCCQYDYSSKWCYCYSSLLLFVIDVVDVVLDVRVALPFAHCFAVCLVSQ